MCEFEYRLAKIEKNLKANHIEDMGIMIGSLKVYCLI